MRAPAFYCPALIKRQPSHYLLVALLTGTLVATSPVLMAEERAAERLKVSQTLPDEANDPLRNWFKEQDRLLDDILVRLARIENLVRDIHQLIVQLPSGPAADLPATPVPSPAPAATKPTPPVTVPALPMPKQAPGGIFGFFEEWGSMLGGLGLLLLVLMITRRHRRSKQSQSTKTADTTSSAGDAAPTPHVDEPAFMQEPEAENKPVAKVVQTVPASKPVTPAKPAAPVTALAKAPEPPAPASSIQRGGATQPSKGQADQALELADIMLSMGLGHGAAQTLTEQIRNEPKQALLHWLKLLEIYRQNGQQAEFEKSAEELRQHFNVQPEDWQVRPESLRSIEDYPHIAARMCELWARPACLVYLQTLLADNRGGARSGFPQSVAEEFLLLTTMLKARGIAPEADAAIGG